MSNLEQQRDELFRETQRAQRCIDEAKLRISDLEMRVAVLEAGLQKYGRCAPNCGAMRTRFGGYWVRGQDCTCGLDLLLKGGGE